MKTPTTWQERCETHPDHQTGMVTNQMIRDRMQEEIDALRAVLEIAPDALLSDDEIKELAGLLNFKCIQACSGLPDGALDGGWTAAGISAYTKKLEVENAKLRAEARAQPVAQGWKLVPIESTSAMDDAGARVCGSYRFADLTYRAMIAASPHAGSGE